MEFEGKVIQYLGESTGTSKSGNPWKKKEWVVETFGQYPRKVKVQCFGDRSDSIVMEPGQDYRLSVDLESREYNGRWYTDVSVFRVTPYTGAQEAAFGAPAQSYQGFGQPAAGVSEGAPYGGGMGSQPTFTPSEDNGEDLPF